MLWDTIWVLSQYKMLICYKIWSTVHLGYYPVDHLGDIIWILSGYYPKDIILSQTFVIHLDDNHNTNTNKEIK